MANSLRENLPIYTRRWYAKQSGVSLTTFAAAVRLYRCCGEDALENAHSGNKSLISFVCCYVAQEKARDAIESAKVRLLMAVAERSCVS